MGQDGILRPIGNRSGLLTKRLLLALVALAGVARPAETVEFKVLAEGVLEDRLRLAHPKVSERFKRLRTLFEEAGFQNLVVQKVKGSKEPNLICSIPAADPAARKIVVAAHFDCAGGDGVIDNWTGAILLPSLAQFVAQKPRKHGFEFVGFAAEEKGLLGSTAYLKALSAEERKRIAAVITMDSLGLTATKCWPNSSNPGLMVAAAQLARAMKLDFAGVNIDPVAATDSITFHMAGIPVLSLHSASRETFLIANSGRDVWSAVSWKDYYDSHRFISALLVFFDQGLP